MAVQYLPSGSGFAHLQAFVTINEVLPDYEIIIRIVLASAKRAETEREQEGGIARVPEAKLL